MSASPIEATRDVTTTTPGLNVVPDAASDPATVSWVNQTQSRDAQLDEASSKISRLLRLPRGWDGHHGETPTVIAGLVANGFIAELVIEGGPTPQITPSPDGGIDIEWLVRGTSVNVSVDPEGYVDLGVDAEGDVLLESEFPYWAPDGWKLAEARRFLHKMSYDVVYAVR